MDFHTAIGTRLQKNVHLRAKVEYTNHGLGPVDPSLPTIKVAADVDMPWQLTCLGTIEFTSPYFDNLQ